MKFKVRIWNVQMQDGKEMLMSLSNIKKMIRTVKNNPNLCVERRTWPNKYWTFVCGNNVIGSLIILK